MLKIKKDTVDKWCKINSNKEHLKKFIGVQNISKFTKISKNNIQNINFICKHFINNFSKII